MDETTRRVLTDVRLELIAIRRTADVALEKLDRLGAGFGPASAVPPVPDPPAGTEIRRVWDVLPVDLRPKLTVVHQEPGLVTITAEWLQRPDWLRLDEKVKSVGGVWVADGKRSRWEVNVP